MYDWLLPAVYLSLLMSQPAVSDSAVMSEHHLLQHKALPLSYIHLLQNPFKPSPMH